MKKLLYLIPIAIILFTSCDIVDDPYAVTITEDTTGNSNRITKNVLLMEFTAIKCRNCPEASARAQDLMDKYEGRVFGMNVHAGILARATGDQPDFVNDDSKLLYELAKNPAQPTGMINYIPQGTADNIANSLEWGPLIQSELNKEAKMSIEIEIEEVSNSDFKVMIDIIYHQAPNSNDQLAVYLTESNLIGYQLDFDTQVDDYQHNHVLRGSLLGTLGENIFDQSISAGDTLRKEINFSVDSEWDPNYMSLIALVYDYEASFVVHQVNEAHLIPHE